MKISDNTSISMPMRNLLSIVAAVAVGVWAYFGVIERLNKLETQGVLIEKDMTAEDERLHNEVHDCRCRCAHNIIRHVFKTWYNVLQKSKSTPATVQLTCA